MVSKEIPHINEIEDQTFCDELILSNNSLSSEDLRKIINAFAKPGCRNEKSIIDFKAKFEESKKGWFELLRDIVAANNSGGGLFIYGIDNLGNEIGCNIKTGKLFDPAVMQDKIKKYAPSAEILVECTEVEIGQNKIYGLKVRPSLHPVIFDKNGQYPEKGENQMIFREGIIYVRDQSQSRPATQKELNKIIENAVSDRIKYDREKQWEKVKSLTYMTILNNIRNVASQFPETGVIDFETINNHMEIINIDVNYPRKDVSDEIMGLAKDINGIYRSRKEFSDDILVELSDEESITLEHEIGCLKHYCNEIGWVLEDMRITLIPRVLQLSDDEEANLALLRFEAFSREFQEDKRKMWLFSDSNIFNSVIQLLDESGRLYEVLQRKMPQKQDFAYHFREPTPFL